jgi:hypothetical protein
MSGTKKTDDEKGFHIHVVGDVATDWILLETKRESDEERTAQPAKIFSAPLKGGAWFVADFIKAAIRSVECDLELMPNVENVNAIQKEGRNRIILATVNGVLHFRIFDLDGKEILDTDEKHLTKQSAEQMPELRKRLENSWPPHELTRDEKTAIINSIISIVNHNICLKNIGSRDSLIETYEWYENLILPLNSQIPSTIWDLDLYPRINDNKNSGYTYRIKRSRGYAFTKGNAPQSEIGHFRREKPDVLVIDDLNLGFRNAQCSIESINNALVDNPNCIVIILISGMSIPANPSERPSKIGEDPGKKSQVVVRLWQFLESHADRCIALIDGDAVRHAGAKISRRISWEATAQEFSAAFPNIQSLSHFNNIVTRFGVTGAIFTQKNNAGSKKQYNHKLTYDPDTTDGIFRYPERDGEIIGYNSVMVAWLVRTAYQLSKSGELKIDEIVNTAMPHALRSCQRLFRHGYGSHSKALERLKPPGDTIFTDDDDNTIDWEHWVSNTIFDFDDNTKDIFSHKTISKDWYSGISPWFPHVVIPHPDIELATGKFDILTKDSAEPEQLFGIASDIIKFGIDDTLLCTRQSDSGKRFTEASYDFNPPVARFGEHFVAIGRETIEGLRSLSELIRNYLASPQTRPLSIAVFGSPGSGKSFSIQSVAQSVDKRIEYLECNLSHFRLGDDQLAREFIRIVDASRGGKTPLMFFDEFDCSDLDFLKGFLAPMEDARFHSDKVEFRLGGAIFVFAGGIYSTYDDLRGRLDKKNDHYTKRKIASQDIDSKIEFYKSRKLPDFLSRLSGHVNLQGIDFDRSDTGFTYLIRRALLIRAFLVQNKLVEENIATKPATARIDENLMYALLAVDRFANGARSIRKIIETASAPRKWLNPAYLQSDNNLDMFVNAHDFNSLITKNYKDIIDTIRKYRAENTDGSDTTQ